MDYAGVREVLKKLRCADWNFDLIDTGYGVFIHVWYHEPDTRTGEMTVQYGRAWHIPAQATESEVVQTALKACLTSAEHRVREAFKYEGEAIYMPHYDVKELKELARRKREESHG